MPRQGRVRAIAAIALVVVAGATAGVVYNRWTDASSPYVTEPVARGTLVQYVRARGELTPVVISVGTQISGTIVQIDAEVMQPIKKGQVLALIDPQAYEQKLEQARSELRRVSAAREFLELKEERYRQLLSNGFITQLNYAEVKAELEQARSDITTKAAAVREAENNLSYCTIRASTDGVLLEKKVNVGETVHVGTSIAPVLFLIAENLTRMRILAPIKEIDVGKVQRGQDVEFTVIALPGRDFHGRVAHILSSFNPQPPQQLSQSAPPSALPSFKVDIEVTNDDLSLQAMFTPRVNIIVNKKEHVLLVPNSALRLERLAGAATGPGKTPWLPVPPILGRTRTEKDIGIVYRFARGSLDAMPEPVIVRLGLTDDVMTEVVNGLEEGDVIVIGLGAAAQTS
jgi:HlyD family secretion protein